MKDGQNRRRLVRGATATTAALAIAAAGTARLEAQRAVAPGAIYQRFAPVDLTGTWVSVVTEDWHLRMITPAAGDFQNLPLTQAAQDSARGWDPARDEAAGRACQAYGAPTIMREPGRVRIGWQDHDTLRVETDAGEQTRLFHFADAEAPDDAAGWQGFSRAEWEYAGGFDPLRVGVDPARGQGRNRRLQEPVGGGLKVVTTKLRAGYLRKNGVPFSENAVVTEYFNLLTEPNLTEWLVVTTIVHDPVNLLVDYITSSNFKKEPDDSNWQPTPCTVQ